MTINKRRITKVIIDSHYEDKHSESIDDKIILRLVEKLDGKLFEPEDRNGLYSYFVTDKIELDQKPYKLIWLTEENKMYVGVVNAYRTKEK